MQCSCSECQFDRRTAKPTRLGSTREPRSPHRCFQHSNIKLVTAQPISPPPTTSRQSEDNNKKTQPDKHAPMSGQTTSSFPFKPSPMLAPRVPPQMSPRLLPRAPLVPTPPWPIINSILPSPPPTCSWFQQAVAWRPAKRPRAVSTATPNKRPAEQPQQQQQEQQQQQQNQQNQLQHLQHLQQPANSSSAADRCIDSGGHLLLWPSQKQPIVERQPQTRIPLSFDYFYAFVQRRETVRVRREILKTLPNLWCPKGWDDIMRGTRLTNVRRENDRTTRVMRGVSNPVLKMWMDMPVTPGGEWSLERKKLAGLFVFNYALWRAFGDKGFAEKLSFIQNIQDWDDKVMLRVVNVALSRLDEGHYNFTDAYSPPRNLRGAEMSMHNSVSTDKTSKAREIAQRAYNKVCQKLRYIWEARLHIVETARTTLSWRQTTYRVMQVHGYGGTGFLAKELVQDLIHGSPLFKDQDPTTREWCTVCTDMNSWCIVGPGARRGLNRIHGREVRHNAYSPDQSLAQRFLQELLELFEQRKSSWPEYIEGVATEKLELHDVQFQLCEIDKYERARLAEGRIRPYRRLETTWPGRGLTEDAAVAWPKMPPAEPPF
jgi:hypothetical protein